MNTLGGGPKELGMKTKEKEGKTIMEERSNAGATMEGSSRFFATGCYRYNTHLGTAALAASAAVVASDLEPKSCTKMIL